MVWFFTARGTEVIRAVWTADTRLCHVLSRLLSQQVSLLVFLLVVYLSSGDLECVATLALNKA